MKIGENLKTHRLKTFDQRPYQRSVSEPGSWRNGLTPTGLLYVPPGCDGNGYGYGGGGEVDGGEAGSSNANTGGGGGEACQLVLLFHGCNGYCSLDYVRHNGLLKHAATNRMVVLAPQVGSIYVGGGPANGTVQTCFDNYGDTGPNYCLRNGTQNVAVHRMVQCITGAGPCP